MNAEPHDNAVQHDRDDDGLEDQRDRRGDIEVRRVLDKPEQYPLTPKKRELVESVATRLEAIVKRGEVKAEDRTWLLWNARLLLATVF